MEFLILLAAASQAATQTDGTRRIIPIDMLWKYVVELGPVESLTFISFGVVWLFYGWRIFKILVTICFSMLGLLAGVYLHKELIGGQVVWLSILFMLLFGFLAVWFMKWSVSLLGAVAGGVLTSGIWMACGFPEHLIWAGALIGFVAGGMMSFIIFKGAVMLFTSLGGSGLIVTGFLAIFYDYLGAGERLHELVYGQRWFLPVLLLTPMIAGMVAQHKFMKASDDCDL